MGSWDVDTSSGFLTGFTGKVVDSYAGTDPRYNEGDTTLVTWEVEVVEVLQDYDGEIPESLNVSFPVGAGWSTEDGETVEHEKGRDRFHASSAYGKIVANAAGKVEGYGENATRTDGEDLVVDLTSVMPVLDERAGDAGPQLVTIWKDFTFEFAEVHFDFGINRKTKERMESNRTMPVAVVELPEGEGKAKATKATKATKASKASKATKATKATAAKETPADEAPAVNDKVAAARERAAAAKAAAAAKDAAGSEDPFAFVEDDDVRAELNEVLATSEDFASAYIDGVLAVLEKAGLATDDALLEQCIDEDNGPWSTKS